MREILFLCHRIPFPPDRGDKIRSHHVLRRLAGMAKVHVATFADDDFDMGEENELTSMASSYRLVRRTKPLPLAGIEALARGRPVSFTAFHDRALSAYVDDVLASRPISAIYVFSGQMGQYVPAGFRGRVIADFVDVDSAKFEAYAARKGFVGRINAREARLLRAQEARLAARADVSLLVTRAEAELFASRLPAGLRDGTAVRVLPNGIDGVRFDPAVVPVDMRMEDLARPRLIFTGQMDYAPNVAAALRVADGILPLIREELPDAGFHVVGRNPVPELLARDGKGSCRVWGRVEDIRPWLKAADLAIVPLEIARGVQNKVLEAMAMSLPVVLTTDAAEGIGASPGEHLAVADSDAELAACAVALLRDSCKAREMGAAARRFVTERASWQAALEPLAEMLDGDPGAARDAA